MTHIKFNHLFLFALLVFLFACKAKNKNAEDTAGNSRKNFPSVAEMVNLIGSYVGNFGDNKITILITRATNDSVEGRSVVGGYDRPFSGTIRQAGTIVNIQAKEPGGDPHDGTFDFFIDSNTPDMVKGSWKPYQPTEKITGKEYTLQRRAFAYLPDAGVYPQASQRLLKEDDVDNLSKSDLEFMRNEIFARHGYCFKKKMLRQEFEEEEWYTPNTADIKNLLTDIERKNIALIKKYEKYAEEYGDEFGR